MEKTTDGTKLMSRWVTCIGRPHEVEVTGGGGGGYNRLYGSVMMEVI